MRGFPTAADRPFTVAGAPMFTNSAPAMVGRTASAADGAVGYTSTPVFGPMRPMGHAPLVPGTPGGLPPELMTTSAGPAAYGAAYGDASGSASGSVAEMQPGWPEPEKAQRPRLIVKQARPRFAGGPEFYGGVPKNSATFAWSEACVTRDCDATLAPTPETHMKSWYNTYLYVPEERSHIERGFLDRFVQGPSGEWIDVVKARRVSTYMADKREQAMVSQMERAMITSGSAVKETGYTDPYSGERLVACRGELLPRQQLLERVDPNSAGAVMREMVEDAAGGFDFANLRVPWPFGRPYRNKMVTQHLYDWFDRQNPYIPSDQSVEILELPSAYVEREQFDRWGAAGAPAGGREYLGGPGLPQQRVQRVQM